MKRVTLCCMIALALCQAVGPAAAAPLPANTRAVQMEARDQPIDQFLQQLFAPLDIPVAVSPAANGLVNGRFTGPADKLLRDISRAYNLVSYYDGAVLYVAPATEMVSRSYVLATTQAQQVLRSAQELQLTDNRNTLRSAKDGTLVAIGARRYMQQVDELVRQIRPVGGPGPASAAWTQPLLDYRVFYLRYAWAQDVTISFGGKQTMVPGVASILRSLVGQPGHTTTPDANRSAARRLGGQGLARQSGSSVMPTLGQNDDGARGLDTLVNALTQTTNYNNPAPIDNGASAGSMDPMVQTRIEADQRLNAVIVRDLPERLARYAELVKALDIEPQALEIEATIIDINTDKLRELGVNWRITHGFNSTMLGSGTVSDLRLDGQQDPTPSLRGLAISAVLGDRNQFVARVSALQVEGAAKIVSSPQVVTLSNVEAVFDNSSTFYVRVAGRDQVDLFNVTAGTTLSVTPHVFRDADVTRIKLLVQIEDGNITTQTVDTLPVVERSGVNTQALITEGESLLIGGMVRDSSRIGEDKVPLLGDIPLIGNLFKTQSTGGGRLERLFLITPRLASGRGAAAAAERARQPIGPVSANRPGPAALAPATPVAGVPTTPVALSANRSARAAVVPATPVALTATATATGPTLIPAAPVPGSDRGYHEPWPISAAP
jgi:type III secretion protein C